MNSHVESELLAYLDEELDERERTQVEAHLATCSRCTAELERLRTLRQELGATFDAALSPVRLPAEADERIRGFLRQRSERHTAPRPWLGLWRRRGLVAQGLLAALVLFFAVNTAQVLRLPAPAAPHQTLVLGQDRLAPGSQAALRVVVQSTEEAEAITGADVVVKIGRTPGEARIVYTGQTDASGTANVSFTIPRDLEGQADLVVETSSPGGTDQIVSPIVIERDYKLLLSSDKPAYRPGQTIHMRTLALDAVNLKPVVDQQIAFYIAGPQGQDMVYQKVDASEFGIAAFDFALPSDALHGQYTLRAKLGDTASERTVTVGDYDLPAFRVTLETDRDYYGPGERVSGTVQAEYFFGKPVTGGKVTLRGYTTSPRGDPTRIVQGETDADGVFKFALVLPASFGASTTTEPVFFDLEADVVDAAGQRAGIRHFLPVTAQTLLIRAVPESGRLKPGIENVVFIMTAYPDGRPAQTTLTVEAEGRSRTLTTNAYGLAEFRYVPGASSQITIRAEDAQGNQSDAAFSFQRDSFPQVLLLRTERVAYEVGDTLRAEVLTSGLEESVQTIYLDVVRTRQTIATLSAPIEDGRAAFALDLDDTMVGTLELHTYIIGADDTIVRDTRLVIVDAPRQVAVAVSADRQSYRPGETAHLQIQTALASPNRPTDQPVQAALGIGVVDESVYALETLPPGFVQAYFLLEEELAERGAQGLDVPALLDATKEIRETQEKAARAAWAGVPGTDFSLAETSTARPTADTVWVARAALADRIGLVLATLPLLLSGVVAQGLWLSGSLKRALRRVIVGVLVLFVASPVVGLVAGGVMLLLWTVLGIGAPLLILLAIIALLIWLAVHGWRKRDTRAQLAAGLLTAYVVLAGLLVALAARGGDPAGWVIALIVITFLLAVVALATLGQGLVLEGRRVTGWATTMLALLLIPLAVYLPFVPGAASNLTRALGNPAVYTGPLGWLTGCCPAMAPEPVEKEAAATKIVEKEAEEIAVTAEAAAEPTKMAELTAPPEMAPTEAPPVTEPTEAPPAATTEPTEPAAEATLAPEPTTTPAPLVPPPTPAPTTVPLPSEPYPLRQVFPETLYWDAEATTGEDGTLALDLPLADSVTTWRLTALASTREGDLGTATYAIVVFQDFFAELDLPATVTQGEAVTVTVTLYNYLGQAQTIQLAPQPAGWYTLESPPQALTLPPSGVASTTFVIRAEETGDFALQVIAIGEGMSDEVAAEVTVAEAP
ncbi:MAG: zf-HC2 domain-containing protein [Anaerolineae bacterium]|nr:zf-HC2 domain-containing protein [Anaerolineae bacterium]